jgi:hypothetical protein
LKKVFNCVKIGPSAVNKQSWKIVKVGNDDFHFFTSPSSSYYSFLDIGIALAHWDIACKELGLGGLFYKEKNVEVGQPKGAIYFFTWKMDGEKKEEVKKEEVKKEDNVNVVVEEKKVEVKKVEEEKKDEIKKIEEKKEEEEKEQFKKEELKKIEETK